MCVIIYISVYIIMSIYIYGYILCYLANNAYYIKLCGITDVANTLGHIHFNSLASLWNLPLTRTTPNGVQGRS